MHQKLSVLAATNSVIKMTAKKDLGQYFTISNDLQQFVFDMVKHKSQLLLEPSFGAGHLLQKFLTHDSNYPMVCCELDSTVKPVVIFNEHQQIIYGDFTKQQISNRFRTIIGNPPYVKRRAASNLYIKFIEQCYDLLEEDGELIFIVPSDFIKLTSAAPIIQRMTTTGSFTDFLFPNNERLFENASIDVVVFRYEKGLKTETAMVNGVTKYANVRNGIITFSDTKVVGTPISELFNVYVGLVTGKDEIYKSASYGNLDLLNDKDRTEKYIFPEKFPTGSAEIDAHLLSHKESLMARRIKKFTETNWFEWGAPRNIMSIRNKAGRLCIYVRNVTRSKEVAFLGKVQYFGGGLLCLVPKTEEMTEAQLQTVLVALNSPEFQKDYIYAGRFKIGHKQLCNAVIADSG
jgi:adenine-specific DNA-methyltransferase